MGLLTCGRCGCAITAEKKKAKYVYYGCTEFRGRCGNNYIREEQLSELLGKVVDRIQIRTELADWLADRLRDSYEETEHARQETVARLAHRRHSVQSKLDRAYDDYLEGRLSSSLWTRKSAEWESEPSTIDAELSRLSQPSTAYIMTGEKILELAKTAHCRYLEQDPIQQRRLLDTVLSNCTFDREVFVRLTLSRSTSCHRVEKLGIGGVDGTRTRGLRRDRPAF